MNEKQFDFSIITAVYNTELFVAETIESVLAQDFGFDRVQLILVDDGSKDGSGAICDSYQRRYPENITVIHQKNGGASHARNAGLEIATGTIVNFLDSDDKLSSNALTEAWKFFEKYGEEADVAALPLIFFDQRKGAHWLNDKFDKGTRVIDLEEEWKVVQFHFSSCFVRRKAIGDARFDTQLRYSEDAKLVQLLMLEKHQLGVVAEAKYLYRRRSAGEASLIQSADETADWYLAVMERYSQEMLDICRQRFGAVPRYIQYAVMYDLKWRIQRTNAGEAVLGEEGSRRYREAIRCLLKQIDDEVIFTQKSLLIEYKYFALTMKYGALPGWHKTEKDILFEMGAGNTFAASAFKVRLDFVTIERDGCSIEGYIPVLPVACEQMEMNVLVNGVAYPTEFVDRRAPKMALGEKILDFIGFRVKFPVSSDVVRVRFVMKYDGHCVEQKRLGFGKMAPLHEGYKQSYYTHAGRILTHEAGELRIEHCGWLKRAAQEIRFLRQLKEKKQTGNKMVILARLARHILKPLVRKPIWLLSDRVMRADDNGEAFFSYLREHKRNEVRAIFVLSPESPDYERLRALGPVVTPFSFRHKLLLLLCEYNLSAAGDEEDRNPFLGYDQGYRDLLQNVRYVFLQHGITHNDVSGWLNRFNKGIHGFVTAAVPEYRSILEGKYHYSSEEVWLTGFPRYDKLYHQEENIIALMPTWRKYLLKQKEQRTGTWRLADNFEQSAYFCFYSGLLKHPRLLAALKEKGYRLLLVQHPHMIQSNDRFTAGEGVEIIGEECVRYSEIFAKSRLVITDYSSVVFDFAYLRKPLLYCQFDAEEFFSGKHTYERGYFDHEKDGFGEVTHDLEETVDCIIAYLESDCELKEKYRARIDGFYAYNDRNNCQRLYERLIDSRKKK